MAILSILIVVAIFVLLQLRRNLATDQLFLAGLLVLTIANVITPAEAFEGLSNPAVLTIAGLLVVTAGLRSAGVLDWLGNKLLGSARTQTQALIRLTLVITVASAFLLNTAVVAMMMPVAIDWCRRRNISPSRLLIPISYLAMLGGVCTLIGTSTTLVVNGELTRIHQQQLDAAAIAPRATSPETNDSIAQVEPMSLFELGQIGSICAIIGVVYIIFIAPRLLPDRHEPGESLGKQRREYMVEMKVEQTCPYVGQTVQQAGLRNLPGLFLVEINRAGHVITPVAPSDVIEQHDRLVFSGVVSTIVDLEKVTGLVPSADVSFEHHPERRLSEVVLSRTCPLIGTTVKAASFRQRYNAAVVAVHRSGERLAGKIGDIELAHGDTLLLQTRSDFVSTYRNSRDFYLVSDVEGATPRRHEKIKIASLLLLTLITWLITASIYTSPSSSYSWTSPAVAAIVIAVLMVLTGCLRNTDARAAIDLQLLLTIAAALGIGRALIKSGAAEMVANGLTSAVGTSPLLLLITVYILASVMTEMISNNAVAAMLLPLAIAIPHSIGFDARPFIMAITLAASLAFVTPVGYQTNLMVMGPGGYHPRDYLRCGLPLSLLMAVTAITSIAVTYSVGP
ncbi:MAG TPA: SLC13 family permease [Planctomycetaceae bacterium]|nr:SLC13 family permease [Planctomycetaceae bacterium]|tara:strand:+ start:9074 stop:10939 length:1866 start_codon:yes stop_codon:yes gene_type:complete